MVTLFFYVGYYTCYTLAVDLGSTCNADQGATFTASPNDPSMANCTCPVRSSNSCNPYVNLTTVSHLKYLVTMVRFTTAL